MSHSAIALTPQMQAGGGGGGGGVCVCVCVCVGGGGGVYGGSRHKLPSNNHAIMCT